MSTPAHLSPNDPPPVQRAGSRTCAGIFGASVSAALAIPLAMGYGMFAFVALGDQYFASGCWPVWSGLHAGRGQPDIGDRTTTIYAPRVVTTFSGLILAQELCRLGRGDIRRMQPVLSRWCSSFSQPVFPVPVRPAAGGLVAQITPHPVLADFKTWRCSRVGTGRPRSLSHHVRLAEVISNCRTRSLSTSWPR
jgi:hypothetical protein